jgi:small subunit ribosomal protein S17
MADDTTKSTADEATADETAAADQDAAEATAEEATADEATAEVEGPTAVPADAVPVEAPAAEEGTPAEQAAALTVAEDAGELATAAAATTQALFAPKEEDTGERNARKERVGIVVSDKMEKTIAVLVRRQTKHPMYSKYLERSTKLLAHDETNDAGEGDTVRIMETRPTSKRKRWRLVEIIERAK